MSIDPNNLVVKLCADGMQAEASGRMDLANRQFEKAWAVHSTDFEACIAVEAAE